MKFQFIPFLVLMMTACQFDTVGINALKESNCADGIDNDGDGFVDCDDQDCFGHPACVGNNLNNSNNINNANNQNNTNNTNNTNNLNNVNPEICDNGIDDNGNGMTDCDDPECAGELHCQPEICDNGIDDNGNGMIDCDDPECAGELHCQPEICDNGVDDNGNGMIDCEDSQCATSPSCTSACNSIFSLTCGSVLEHTTTGAPSVFTTYPACMAYEFTGPERAYSIQLPAGREFILTLTPQGNQIDPELILIRGACGTANCVAFSINGPGQTETISHTSDGGTYHVIVDTWIGEGLTPGGYTLSMACPQPEICDDGIDNDLDGFTDCTDTDCLGLTSGTNNCGQCDVITNYGCSDPFTGMYCIFNRSTGYVGSCTFTLGPGVAGSTCTSEADCSQGLFCNNGESPRRCRRLCRLGLSDCPSSTCQPVPSWGTTHYGYCPW